MRASLTFDLSSLQKQFNELSRTSSRTIQQQNAMNSQMVMRSVMFNTPRQRGKTGGSLRAGWQPAYMSAQAPGKGGTRKRAGEEYRYFKNRAGDRTYYPVGKVDNQNNNKWRPYFAFSNSTYLKFNNLEKLERTKYMKRLGKYVDGSGRFWYGEYALRKSNFMRKAEQEVSRKIETLTERNFERKLKRIRF